MKAVALPDWPFRDSHRREVIVRLVQSGMTGAAVGERLGITRERVRQVWTAETGTPLPTHERQRAQSAARLRRCRYCQTDYTGRWASHRRAEAHIRCLSASAERRYERVKAGLRATYHRLHPKARYYRSRTTP